MRCACTFGILNYLQRSSETQAGEASEKDSVTPCLRVESCSVLSVPAGDEESVRAPLRLRKRRADGGHPTRSSTETEYLCFCIQHTTDSIFQGGDIEVDEQSRRAAG